MNVRWLLYKAVAVMLEGISAKISSMMVSVNFSKYWKISIFLPLLKPVSERVLTYPRNELKLTYHYI